MESAQYTQWEISEEFEMADTKRQWRPWEAGWWVKQLPGGRPALPFYLLFSVTSFLWIALLSMLLAKVTDLSKEVEHLEGIQGNGSMNSGRLEVLQVALSTLDNKHQTLKTKGSSCQPCPSTWRDFQGSCYFFSENKLTWSQARDDCVQKQAHLVIINNRDEQNFLTPTDILGYWIGLRKVQEGVHKWIDGTELGYTNWNFGEPNDSQGKENCVMMLHHGKWNDFTCEQSSDNWICEKRQIC
ncbi:C-type lectin domain family 4 member G isoform X3 [Vombatus ursinus]|uniref:C-type lectin domain family 4 member G isoform X3 n=1 Tax=Vombatus ursinus TaxID=29139 RepID=UPI000FFD9969|nr:C-type lectin domain family 4 member G isoform X3 [Vombatus ursinus]